AAGDGERSLPVRLPGAADRAPDWERPEELRVNGELERADAGDRHGVDQALAGAYARVLDARPDARLRDGDRRLGPVRARRHERLVQRPLGDRLLERVVAGRVDADRPGREGAAV